MCMFRAKSADTYVGYITVSLLTTDVNFDQTLIIRDTDDQPHKYMLQGVAYFGSSHFVSHIVDDNLDVMRSSTCQFELDKDTGGQCQGRKTQRQSTQRPR